MNGFIWEGGYEPGNPPKYAHGVYKGTSLILITAGQSWTMKVSSTNH